MEDRGWGFKDKAQEDMVWEPKDREAAGFSMGQAWAMFKGDLLEPLGWADWGRGTRRTIAVQITPTNTWTTNIPPQLTQRLMPPTASMRQTIQVGWPTGGWVRWATVA